MNKIKFTLIGDGSSDKTLLQIIKWLLDDLYPNILFEGVFASYSHLKNAPKNGEIQKNVDLAKFHYPFDVLFYHRDAEKRNQTIVAERKLEILSRLREDDKPNVVCVVPIVMMESWLLFNLEAIKKAAGNRNYNEELMLPTLSKVESITNPKQLLHTALTSASGLNGRRLKKFNPNAAVHLVAENITDYSPLRELSSFILFETDLKLVIDSFIYRISNECKGE